MDYTHNRRNVRDDVCCCIRVIKKWSGCCVVCRKVLLDEKWIVRFDSSICYLVNFDFEVVEFADDLAGAMGNSAYIDAI